MAAALPSSLKLASETTVVLDTSWERDMESLNDKEFLLVEALQLQEVLSIKEISEILQIKTVQPVIKALIDKGVVTTEEELNMRYKPKMEEFVTLTERATNDHFLQDIFDSLEKRAPKQLELLISFFNLTGSLPHGEREVSKLELQRSVEAQSGLTQKLVEKDVFKLTSKEVDRLKERMASDQPQKVLSDEQGQSRDEIRDSWKEKDIVLFHGVTGSGKTEVYVELIKEIIDQGKQVLYLLPEIALTTQIILRLERYFGNRIGVYHSKFNQNERAEIWNKVLNHTPGTYDIILGARSSVFLPFSNLGLVVVDEEHETSYKQYDPAPRYNGRDAALVLSKLHNAKVLLGSATPAVESNWNALKGNYGLVKLLSRFGGLQLPEVQCADIKRELKRGTMKGIFTSALTNEIDEVLNKGEQVILFQNRRGFSPLWQCGVCGEIPNCTRCDVSLTYHKHIHKLKCHYCGYTTGPPNECHACGSTDLKMLGFGTEKIEEDIGELFPNAKTQRMDLDTTRSKNAYQRIINDFESGLIDILVGTQMITKGLDFDNVALVGILNADQMLNFPDFRSLERSYQLMAQVSGRSGRKHKRGKVVVQTYTPDHRVIRQVMDNDFSGMYNHELEERRNFYYPPFHRLIKIQVRHKDKNISFACARDLANELKNRLGDRVLGPEPPYIGRINNRYLQNVMIKIEREAPLKTTKSFIRSTINEINGRTSYKSVRIVIDVDPL
jgi:primosomal protein N' (replication factor Y)